MLHLYIKSLWFRPISNWKGIPNNIDAALKYSNGYTYFFKDGLFYRINDSALEVMNRINKFILNSLFCFKYHIICGQLIKIYNLKTF
jgi:Hemopexin